MPNVVFSSDILRFTGNEREADVDALNYPALVKELLRRYPTLPEETLRKQSLAVNGMIVHTPMLEQFQSDSKLVFVARIAGG